MTESVFSEKLIFFIFFLIARKLFIFDDNFLINVCETFTKRFFVAGQRRQIICNYLLISGTFCNFEIHMKIVLGKVLQKMFSVRKMILKFDFSSCKSPSLDLSEDYIHFLSILDFTWFLKEWKEVYENVF